MNSELIFDEIWERIKSTTGWKSYGEFAIFLGIKASSISGAKKRERMPIEWIMRVAEKFREPLDWFVYGAWPALNCEDFGISQGEMQLARDTRNKARKRSFSEGFVGPMGVTDKAKYSATDQSTLYEAKDGILDQDEYALIPRYAVEVSAGGGSLVDNEVMIGTMAFKREWLRRMGFEVGRLVLVTARGDSMEPTVSDGDLLLVDMRQAEIVDGAIHVIRSNDHILVKRLQMGMTGQVIVRSDNPRYSPMESTRDALQVVGRVVWRGGRM